MSGVIKSDSARATYYRPRGDRQAVKCFRVGFFFLLFTSLGLFASPPETIPDGYHVEDVPLPEGVTLEPSGMDFHPETGVLYVATRYGEVWTYDGGNWNKFAEGLHDPTGLLITKEGHILVGQKPEVTRLIDTDQDGRSDVFRSINHSWGLSRNYCEYTHGPVRDGNGNLFVTLNLSDLWPQPNHPGRVRADGMAGVMGRNAKYRGWCVRITPDGKMDPYAYGLRSPSGIGRSPKGEVFVAINQGDWMPYSGLVRIQRNNFYGHPSSLMDHKKFRDRNLDKVPIEKLNEMRTRPAVWFPYGEISHSPGNPVWGTSEGKFGPFQGQIFIGDQTRANVFRVALEKVNGRYQGAVFNFVDHLKSGALRVQFGPEQKALWVGQTDRGWPSVGDKSYALQRIVHDGETVPFAMRNIRLTTNGFTINFTRPVERSSANDSDQYKVEHWGYKYRPDYGTPQVGRTEAPVKSVSIEEEGERVRLTLQRELKTDRIYRIQLNDVVARNGDAPTVDAGFYTVNQLRKK